MTKAWCGQGVGDLRDRKLPTELPFFRGMTDIAEIACGGDHTVVMLRNGSLYGFGKARQLPRMNRLAPDPRPSTLRANLDLSGVLPRKVGVVNFSVARGRRCKRVAGGR